MKHEKVEIVDHKIIKLSHRVHGNQYALVLKFDNGEQRVTRLPDTFPTGPEKNFFDETTEFQIAANLRILQATQRLITEGPKPKRGHHKTCGEAMQAYLVWHKKNRRNPKIKNSAKFFITQFGEQRTANITREAAGEWVEKLIAQGYAYDTVRIIVMTASGMVSWLIEQDAWIGRNPFSNILKNYKNRFPAREPSKSYFSEEEMEKILTAVKAEKYKAARIFIEVARSTGIRPSEIFGMNTSDYPGLDTKRLDFQNLTWTFLVSKTQGRPFYREIAVPQSLATFIINEGISGVLYNSEWDVRAQFGYLQKETGIKFTQKSFRKHFAHAMEMAGASSDIINLQQGRSQHGVLYEHYLTDPGRAVRICRPYINKMFGERAGLTLVK